MYQQALAAHTLTRTHTLSLLQRPSIYRGRSVCLIWVKSLGRQRLDLQTAGTAAAANGGRQRL